MCSSCFADSIPNFCFCCIRRFRDTVAALVCIGTIELVRLVVAAFCAIQKRIKPLCPCGNFCLALSRLLRKVHSTLRQRRSRNEQPFRSAYSFASWTIVAGKSITTPIFIASFPLPCLPQIITYFPIRDSRISRRSLERQEVLFRRSPVGWRRREDTPPYRFLSRGTRDPTVGSDRPPGNVPDGMSRINTPLRLPNIGISVHFSNVWISRRTPRIIAKPPRPNQARRFSNDTKSVRPIL